MTKGPIFCECGNPKPKDNREGCLPCRDLTNRRGRAEDGITSTETHSYGEYYRSHARLDSDSDLLSHLLYDGSSLAKCYRPENQNWNEKVQNTFLGRVSRVRKEPESPVL